MSKSIAIVLLLAIVCAGTSFAQGDNVKDGYAVAADQFLKGTIQNGFYIMSVSDLINATKADNKSLLILDVMPAEMYAKGHIPESINIPNMELMERLSEIPKDKKIVAVCQKGINSAYAVAMLRIFGGHDNAWVLLDGLDGWTAAGQELVT